MDTQSTTKPKTKATKAPSKGRYEDLIREIDSVSTAVDNITALQRQAMVGLNTAAIAHEINNLLAPMIAFAQLAKSKPDRQDLNEKAIELAIEQGQQAGRVLNALLGFANPSSDKEAETTGLIDAVDGAIQCLGRDPAKDGTRIAKNIPEVHVKIGRIAAQQVIYNLLHNAARAIPGKGGLIEITTTQEDGFTTLRCRDNGCGVPPADQADLFTPYRKGEHSKGHGLGLYLSQKLARDAGGDLTLENTGHEGTCFAFRMQNAF